MVAIEAAKQKFVPSSLIPPYQKSIYQNRDRGQKVNFDKILALVYDWYKWSNINDEDTEINIDEPCHVYIYKEA